MKKLLCLVALYFGKLPENLPFFLKTCEANPEYNWLLFTDDRTEYHYPANVEVKYCTFDELKKRIQALFDFEVSLEYPKRLCSFKPAYGYIFEEELRNYEYWGYCDIDQVFGRMDYYIPAEKIREYDKLYCLGHLTIYRNNKEINSIFKNKSANPGLKVVSYEDIFKGLDVAFDEWSEESVTVNTLFEEAGLKVYYAYDYCDIGPFVSSYIESIFDLEIRNWKVSGDSGFVFVYKGGHLYKVFFDKKSKSYRYVEAFYVHLQKRRFSIEFAPSADCFIIYNNMMRSFSEAEERAILKKAFRAVRIRSFFKVDETKHFLKCKINLIKTFFYNKIFAKK